MFAPLLMFGSDIGIKWSYENMSQTWMMNSNVSNGRIEAFKIEKSKGLEWDAKIWASSFSGMQ